MKRKFTKIFALVSSLVMSFAAIGFSGCTDTSNTNYTTIELKDNQALITNPNMGWNFAYYSNTFENFHPWLGPGDYLDDFPCDLIMMRVGWNYWEPQEGQYDWERFESVLRPWWERDKRVILGFVVTHVGAQNTPLWVKEKGAAGKMVFWDKAMKSYDAETGTIYDEEDDRLFLSYSSHDTNQNGRLDEGEEDPNGDGKLDPTWQSPDKHGAFTENTSEVVDYALNRGSENDPNWNNGEEVAEGDYLNYRPTWLADYEDEIFLESFENFIKAAAERYDNHPGVEAIDIRSLGAWGEGHPAGVGIVPVTMSAKKKHVELFIKHFKNKQIVANDDLNFSSEVLVDYTNRGVGVVDDSIDCRPDAPHISDGNEYYCGMVWEKEPVMLENHVGKAPTENLLKAIENCHASYARIHYSPDAYIRTGIVDQMTLRLGYRLTFTEVKVPEMTMGTDATIKFKMKNTGVAPCYAGGNPTFYIVDSLGSILCTAVSNFDVKNLTVGASAEEAPEFEGTATLKLPKKFFDDQEGRYYLMVAVTKTENGETTPYYNLPLDNQDADGRRMYTIGQFSIGEVY